VATQREKQSNRHLNPNGGFNADGLLINPCKWVTTDSAAESMIKLSLAPVAPGFSLLAADFASAPWLGHAGVSFQGLMRG
jgi:hypothetical protein